MLRFSCSPILFCSQTYLFKIYSPGISLLMNIEYVQSSHVFCLLQEKLKSKLFAVQHEQVSLWEVQDTVALTAPAFALVRSVHSAVDGLKKSEMTLSIRQVQIHGWGDV